jgi:hypothetical protein
MNNKSKTWNILPKYDSNTNTWSNSGSGYFEKWIEAESKKTLPTEQEMIKKILTGVEDVGFFKDILDWLKKMAPKRVPRFLEELYIPLQGDNPGLFCSYESLCEIVYKFGFKASETIEKRMILGSNNKWVQEYFRDFHPS